jgi:hypothetical protein
MWMCFSPKVGTEENLALRMRERCHYSGMHKTRFHDAQLIRTPGWPLFFVLCAALAIIIYMAIKMAR